MKRRAGFSQCDDLASFLIIGMLSLGALILVGRYSTRIEAAKYQISVAANILWVLGLAVFMYFMECFSFSPGNEVVCAFATRPLSPPVLPSFAASPTLLAMNHRRAEAARTVSLFCVPIVLLAALPMAHKHRTQNATQQLVAGLDGLSMPNRTPVASLLKRGADPNARNAWGDTVLHLAVYRAPQSVAALLSHGADPNALNGDGATPLMTAVTSGNPATVRLLLSRGADANVRQRERRDGMTALGWARNAVLLARKIRDPHAARYPVIVRALQQAGGVE